jgi:hypothetical protein
MKMENTQPWELSAMTLLLSLIGSVSVYPLPPLGSFMLPTEHAEYTEFSVEW